MRNGLRQLLLHRFPEANRTDAALVSSPSSRALRIRVYDGYRIWCESHLTK